MNEETDKLEFAVENFLAVLFRDGGQKTGEFDSLPEALYYARDVVLDLIHKGDDATDEIAKLRIANENNLEGWQQNVAGLQRQLQEWQDRCYGAELKNEDG